MPDTSVIISAPTCASRGGNDPAAGRPAHSTSAPGRNLEKSFSAWPANVAISHHSIDELCHPMRGQLEILKGLLFDHLVRATLHRLRHGDAEFVMFHEVYRHLDVCA